jgi:hypothetical protein
MQYKGEHAGRSVQVVNERNTTRACSSCKALTGPSGLSHLAVRQWDCANCGESHDRDVNAARNILMVGSRCRTSVRERVIACCASTEPDTPSAPGSIRRTENGGVSTGVQLDTPKFKDEIARPLWPHWPTDREARAVARSVSAEMHSGFGNLRAEWPLKDEKWTVAGYEIGLG